MITLKLIPESRKGRLLDIALAVRATARGYCDRPDDDQRADLELLKKIVHGWEPTEIKADAEWDAAVLSLVKVAIAEAENYR
jgi:hypothetical protein